MAGRLASVSCNFHLIFMIRPSTLLDSHNSYSDETSKLILIQKSQQLSQGGAYNPLTLLSSAFLSGIDGFLFTALGRIPAQIAGSIIGVRLIKETFPQVGHGPRLTVDIHHGATIEGLLKFMIVLVSLGLQKKDPKSFIMKTWISIFCKMSLHVLGFDLTRGIMNPASALGWAYARGDHITREHLLVYWFAPVQATLLAVWTFRLFAEQG